MGATVKIYFAPFLAKRGVSSCNSVRSLAHGPAERSKKSDWPYDVGDDPSFHAVRKFHGQLSWGICRQDVRNRLSSDDVVVFFSCHKHKKTEDSEYRICSVATVEHKIRHTDIWLDSRWKRFQKYSNLLLKPSKSVRGRWKHYEPMLSGSEAHNDWLWRIAEHRGLRKKGFKTIQETDRLEPGATIEGKTVEIAKNYVLFSGKPSLSYIAPHPPIVAWHSKGDSAETWNDDGFSKAVKRLTLGVAEKATGRKRMLRINNSQRAHRHVVFELPHSDAITWRSILLELLRRE